MSKQQGLKRVGRISDVCESMGTSSETIKLLHKKTLSTHLLYMYKK